MTILGLVLLVVVVGGLCWRKEEAVSLQMRRPSEVMRVSHRSRPNVRSVEVPVNSIPTEHSTSEVSLLVRQVIGQEESTARRYVTRSAAVGQLGDELPDEAVAALLDYLRSTEDVLREERVDALKNDIMNVLRAQKRVSPQLSETLIAMFDSQAYGVAMLDYCVQHLGALQEETADTAERVRIYDCLQRASLVPGASYAGTALIALVHTPQEDDEQRHFVNARVAALVYADDTHEAARVTAVQIAAERGYTELLPVVRRIAKDITESATLRIVAIGALGTFQQAGDVTVLEGLKANAPNARLLPAIEVALKCCQETKE